MIWLSGAAAQAATRPVTSPARAQYADHDGNGSAVAESEHSSIPEGAACDPAGRGEKIMTWLHDGSPFNGGPGSYGNIFMSANVSRWATHSSSPSSASTIQATGPSVQVGPPSPPSNPPAAPPAPPARGNPSPAAPVVTAPPVTTPTTPTVGDITLPAPAANLQVDPPANAPVNGPAVTPTAPGQATPPTPRVVQPSAVTPFVTAPSPSPTPEPGTLLLLTSGIVGLAAARRRKGTSSNG